MIFRKLKDTRTGIQYDWMMTITDLFDLEFFNSEFFKAEVPLAVDNLVKVSQGQSHINSGLAQLIYFNIARIQSTGKNPSLLEGTALTVDRLVNDKIQMIEKYGGIYINKNGGYMPFYEDLEIIDEFTVNKPEDIIFPHYTESDIRIKQWDGGTHYYAYVGMYSVYDYHNNNKWNSKEKAMEEAKYYLYKLNQKAFLFKNEYNIRSKNDYA